MAIKHTATISLSMNIKQSGFEDLSGGESTFNNEMKFSPKPDSLVHKQVWGDVDEIPAGGSMTLDLTALAADAPKQFPDADMTGYRIVKIGLNAGANNAGNITFDVGASNGYNFDGASTGNVTLVPDGAIVMHIPTGTPVVSSTAKNIDITGTAGDVFEICLAAA